MMLKMHKTALFLIVALAGSAMALSPIGPTQAVIGEDQWGVGLNVEFQSMDLEADGTFFEYQTPTRTTKDKIALRDIESISSFLQIGLGLSPEWDIYGCIGTSNGRGDASVDSTLTQATHAFEHGENFGIHADHELAWGIGTRFTLSQSKKYRWGGMVQMTWQGPKGNSRWNTKDTAGGGYTMDGTWKLDTWELIAAFGPTLVYDNVEFYGGPFLHMVRGDLDFNGTYTDISTGNNTGVASTSQDLEEEALVGVYAGMQMDLYKNMLFYMDGQFTGKAWGIGLGTMLRME